MREPRTVTPLDALLLLAAYSHFKSRRTQTFVQKALFCAEDDARAVFPTFPFYRYKYGPYSKEAANTAAELARRGLMCGKDGPLTDRGRRVLCELRESAIAYPEIAAAFKAVEGYASRFATMDLDGVLREVYGRKVQSPFGGLERIENIPELTDLIEPSQPPLERYEQLLELIDWRMSQTDEDARDEEDSPLVSDDRAAAFLEKYLA